MGVYIKGMEMPFTCLNCDFRKCAAGVGDFCSLTKRRQFSFKNRPKDCPLIPVPPHGDLIERDKLAISTAVPLDGKPYQYVHIDNIKSAPVIIPAELSKEET